MAAEEVLGRLVLLLVVVLHRQPTLAVCWSTWQSKPSVLLRTNRINSV
jgi:hypothetical protein